MPLLIAMVASAFAQLPPPAEIAPPFSLSWHEPSERVEGKVEARKLNIVDRRKINGRWALTVTGFRKPNGKDVFPPTIQRVVFIFTQGQLGKTKGSDGTMQERIAGGQLVGVEIQYEEDGWDEEKYAGRISETRRMFERTYGPGQQIIRDTSPVPDGKATRTIVGYKWNKNNTSVELIYFNAATKTGDRVFHTLSLHYKKS